VLELEGPRNAGTQQPSRQDEEAGAASGTPHACRLCAYVLGLGGGILRGVENNQVVVVAEVASTCFNPPPPASSDAKVLTLD
jgi:hypothetical protein